MCKKILHLLYHPYKYLVFVPLFLANYFFFAGLFLILILISPKLTRIVIGFSWSRINSFLTPMCVSVTGREHIEKGRSYVVVSNHQSHYDIFVLHGWLFIDIIWVMKQELRKVPLFGMVCAGTEQIFIDRSNREAALQSLENARKRLTGGTSVIFFAEGTRTKTGKMGEFKKGAFRMAMDLGLPILPVTISGTEKVLPAGTFDLFPGRARLSIHPPIDVTPYEDDIDRLMKDTRDVIEGK
jgi:1-acyl-sn-glycerol-3-phosphate acyltransferase